MASYQEILAERDRLKRRIVELEQRIRLLEGSTALVMARKLHGYRRPVLGVLKLAMAANRARRKLVGNSLSLIPPDTAILDVDFPVAGLDPKRDTILLISHDASQTGAPILCWNIARELVKTFNVVTVLIEGGALAASFADVSSVVVGPLGPETRQVPRARKVAFNLANAYKPLFAIANTAESRYLAAPLAQSKIPVVSLIHEFAAGLFPKGTMQHVFDWSSEIVFPADVVRDSFLPGYQSLRYKHARILSQGQSIVPPMVRDEGRDPTQPTADELRLKLRPPGKENALLVVGMGPADFRKGADLFLATAHIAQRLAPTANFRWAWVGSAHDPLFLNYIGEQMYRSELQHDVVLIDTLDDIDAVYDQADILFVSSRLDPLPNVAIDMALKGKPVLCFDKATGFAEILARRPETARLAVPYLDTAMAAEMLAGLAEHRETLRVMGDALGETARAAFDMPRYVREVVQLGRAAAQRSPRDDDKTLLMQADNFDAPLYIGKDLESGSIREEGIDHYLNYATMIAVHRRALAGFHPGLYAEHVLEKQPGGYVDPLVHYLRAGRPTGVWAHPVIRLDKTAPPIRNAPVAALHGHFHYTDNIADFRLAMKVNKGRYDVYLTTGSEAKRDELTAAMQGFPGQVEIEIVPNLGRDIGPFLHLLRTRLIGRYDIVGHIHGKRSPHAHSIAGNAGELWRVYLWQHLLGPKAAAADAVIAAFAADPALGLVFPEDPNVIGWDENRDFAEDLAQRMDLKGALPVHLDFPVGTMFWARAQALEPFLRLNATWDDYPPEPLPVDGSVLHAMERLIPSVVREAGFTFATTYLPGVGR